MFQLVYSQSMIDGLGSTIAHMERYRNGLFLDTFTGLQFPANSGPV
jgi:hypothetical protein